MGKIEKLWKGWWPERLAALLAMAGLAYAIFSGFHARTFEGDATDFKTLYASSWCLAHGLNPYNFSDLGPVWDLNHVIRPGSWFAHAPTYPFFTLFLLTPLTALPMIQAAYVWIILSIVLLTGVAFLLARTAGEFFGLSRPWRLLVIALVATLPLVSSGLEVTNVSVVCCALCIVVALSYRRANLWLLASAMALSMCLKPHIAPWVLLAFLLGPELRARAVAYRAFALAAAFVSALALGLASAHRLGPLLEGYRTIFHGETTTGCLSVISREFLLVPAQIPSLPSLLGYWLEPTGAQVVSLVILIPLGLLLLRASLRQRRSGGLLTLENIAAWSAIGLVATYHRAADGIVLLILLPTLAARLRAARDSIFVWSVVACFIPLSFNPSQDFRDWLTGLTGSPDLSTFLFFRQGAFAAVVLMLVLVLDEVIRTARRDGLPEATTPTLIDRYPERSFALLSVFYFVVVASLSSVKLLWLDELITLSVARLGSPARIWAELARGSDPNPPVIHLSVMICRQIFGEHALALRLPAIVGYWIGMLALFQFLRRRIPPAWALTGTVISMGMGGFVWSFESRSYGIFYGLAMLALYCWSRIDDAADNTHTRSGAVAGLFLSLAIGVSTNYFGVLAFFPVAAAELTRTIQFARRIPDAPPSAILRQAIRWPVWLAFAFAATPLLLFRPLIAKSIALYAPYAWNKVSLDGALNAYLDMVEWIRYPLMAVAVLAVITGVLAKLCVVCRGKIWPRWIGRLADGQAPTIRRRTLTPPEMAALSMLLLYPLLGYAVASLRGGMLASRFVIPVCFGAAIAGTLLAYRTFGHLRSGGTIALVVALVWFAARTALVGFNYEVQKESFFRVIASIPPPDYPHQPLVLGDNILVLPLLYYAPPEVASRIVYPIDVAGVMDIRKEASAEMNLWTGRNSLYHFPITPLATLQQSTSTYIILTGRDWLIEDLRRHKYQVDDLPIDTHAAGLDLWPTPLAHGKPELFRASGDLAPNPPSQPIPFDLAANLPKIQP